MANYLINDTQLTSVADAIRAKSGGSVGLAFPSEFISEIGNISNGGGGVVSSGNDVIFYDDLMNDCKGGIVYSYSAAEFAKLTEMPANPDHSNFVTHGISIPMTSQGWNWSLANAKAYVKKYGKLNIGQTYIPTDGKSHWICYVPEDAPVERWDTEIHISTSGGSVNWQIDDGIINTSNTYITATFPSVGWHDVKISAPSGVTYYPSYTSSSKTNQLYGKIQKTIQVFIGNNVENISTNSFYSYFSLTSITLPNGITNIGGSAFYNCYSLTSITIPGSVTNIGNTVFYNCYSLASAIISNSVASIGSNVFSSCYSLTSITIPDDITIINGTAFYNCYSLASIIIPDTVTSIGTSAFSGCHDLTTIIIPNSVTSIGSSAFSSCSSLTTITIPDGVTNIDMYSLNSCYSLTSITIPSSVTSIGNYAFYGCYSLTSITIPSDVTSIGGSAFSTCYSLKNIIMESTTPPTLSSSNTFSNLMSDYTIIVPAGSLSNYTSESNWSSLTDHIVEVTA